MHLRLLHTAFLRRRELCAGIKAAYSSKVPNLGNMKVVYQDEQGDWMQLRPEEPWPAFVASARSVLVSAK